MAAKTTRRTASLRALVMGVVVLVVLSPAAFVFVLDLLTRGGDARMRQAVDRAAQQAAEELNTARDPRAALEAAARGYRVRLLLLSPDGAPVHDVDHGPEAENSLGVTSIGSSSGGGAAARPVQPAEAKRAYAAGLTQRCEAVRQGRRLRCRTMIRVATGQGPMLLVSHRSAVRSLQRLTDVQRPLMLLTIFTLLAGVLLAWWLMRRVVQPLEALRGQVVARAARPRASTEPVQLEAPPEVADVVASFNSLLRTLEDQRGATEQFVADLAHELKGPLAAARASVDLLAGEQLEPDARQRVGAAVLASVRRMDATVVQLLELARAEAGVPQEQRQQLDLGQLARETVDAFAAEHAAAGPRFEVQAPDAEVRVDVAPAALCRALTNLLENAAAHARAEVAVTVSAGEEQASLAVADDGPGFSEEVLPRAFERFHTSREHGTGLGLALVRAVAEAHEGSAVAENADGARVTVRLPLAT